MNLSAIIFFSVVANKITFSTVDCAPLHNVMQQMVKADNGGWMAV